MGPPFNVNPSSSVTDSGSGASTVSNKAKDAVVDKAGNVVGGARKTVAEDLNYFKFVLCSYEKTAPRPYP